MHNIIMNISNQTEVFNVNITLVDMDLVYEDFFSFNCSYKYFFMIFHILSIPFNISAQIGVLWWVIWSWKWPPPPKFWPVWNLIWPQPRTASWLYLGLTPLISLSGHRWSHPCNHILSTFGITLGTASCPHLVHTAGGTNGISKTKINAPTW